MEPLSQLAGYSKVRQLVDQGEGGTLSNALVKSK